MYVKDIKHQKRYRARVKEKCLIHEQNMPVIVAERSIFKACTSPERLVVYPFYDFDSASAFCQHLTKLSGQIVHLSHKSVFAGWWARRWGILSCATIRRLWALQLDAVLLAVVALGSASTVVSLVCVRLGVWRVRWSGLGIVVVVVVGLSIVLLARTSSPAGAVEGLATGLATTASGYAAAKDEEEEETDDYDSENDPADPVVPRRSIAAGPAKLVAVTPVITIVILSSLVMHRAKCLDPSNARNQRCFRARNSEVV